MKFIFFFKHQKEEMLSSPPLAYPQGVFKN